MSCEIHKKILAVVHVNTLSPACSSVGVTTDPSSLELEGKEAKQVGSLSRKGGSDRMIGKVTQVTVEVTHVRCEGKIFLQGRCYMSPRQAEHLRERYQYLREVALLEVIYDDLDDKQLSRDAH